MKKRSTVIALFLLVAVLVMGIGYAAITRQFTVTGNAAFGVNVANFPIKIENNSVYGLLFNNICNTEINAFALELNNTINLKVYLKVDPTELGSKMQLQVATAASDLGTGTKVDIDENNPVYVLEDLSLDEMSKTFYFRVTVRYGPTLYYGYTFSYSIESYAARMVDSTEPGLGDLVRAMMEFGKAINAYNA